ncbi:YceI family protein [Nisaea sediminum]|uniref:YceI family protein n=1 Tax=Nisaea sediminum TaxID=2775867 RepID=UPI0018675917|nr:YceI family protein [Nisaea sediminum]
MSLLAVLVMLAAGAAPRAEPARYEVDPDHLSITFRTSHLGLADSRGMFLTGEGSFSFDESAPAIRDIRFTVEPAGAFTPPQTGSDESPVSGTRIAFVGKQSRQTGPRTGTVTGDLTLNGVTGPATLKLTWIDNQDFPFRSKHHAVALSVETRIDDRTFGDTGNPSGEMDLQIDFEAKRVEG